MQSVSDFVLMFRAKFRIQNFDFITINIDFFHICIWCNGLGYEFIRCSFISARLQLRHCSLNILEKIEIIHVVLILLVFMWCDELDTIK